MDLKTLEYMGERVDEARALVAQIENYDRVIDGLKDAGMISIEFVYSNSRGYVKRHETRTHVIASEIKNAAIDIYEKQRAELQKELDEI